MKLAGSQGECALIRDRGRWRGVPRCVPLQAGWEAGNGAREIYKVFLVCL